MQIAKQTSLVKLTTHLFFLLTAMVFLFSCSKDKLDGPVAKNAELTTDKSPQASAAKGTVGVPYENILYVSCANDGAGEYVQLSGLTNLLYTTSWTDHGFTFGYHFNSYNIKGVGLTSGETFVASGTTEGQVAASWVNDQWIVTIMDQLRVTGSSANFIIRNTYHITTTPADDVVIKRADHEVECK